MTTTRRTLSTPWNPCDNGLTPIADALERCKKASVTDLPERLKYASTCPGHVLCREVNDQSALGDWAAPPRLEMVRRWLQTNGFVADARELKERWARILRLFRKWERMARIDIAPPGSSSLFCCQVTCDRYDYILGLIGDLADWCRQLAWMIRPKLKAPAPQKRKPAPHNRGKASEKTKMIESLFAKGASPMQVSIEVPSVTAAAARTAKSRWKKKTAKRSAT